MTEPADRRYMRLALSLGRRGQGQTSPNPAVGCVIVNQGRVVGRGWTQAGGRPHAETMALGQAGDLAAGATAYVTLEPCAHFGQTPPCAHALIAARVARVVYAVGDPDPRVDGSGAAMLRSAGIAVEAGVLEAEARDDHAGFFLRVRDGRPLVTLKLAMSLDGRIATGSGQSQWITGPEARRVVHAMRARHDAVLVGAGTARQDDPSLTVRGLGIASQPVRIVLSRRLDLPRDSQLARSAKDVPLILCHGPDCAEEAIRFWEGRGARLLSCPMQASHLDSLGVLRRLGETGLTRIFCEGGGALAASLIEGDLVDRAAVFTAGFSIGAEGLPGIGALGLEHLGNAHRFTLTDTRAVGPDVLTLWRRIQATPLPTTFDY